MDKGSWSRRLRAAAAYSFFVTIPTLPFTTAGIALRRGPHPDLPRLAFDWIVVTAILGACYAGVSLFASGGRASQWRAAIAAAFVGLFLYNAARGVNSSASLGVWAVGYAALVVVAWRVGGRSTWREVVSFGGAIAVAAGLVTLGLTRPPAPDVYEVPALTVTRPLNVYLILLDGYAGQQTMLDKYHQTEAGWAAELRTRGFGIIHHTSNYPETESSMSSEFSMDYLAPGRDPSSPAVIATELSRMAGRNPFVDALRRVGYEYVHYSSAPVFLPCTEVRADRCIQYDRPIRATDSALASMTPLFSPAIHAWARTMFGRFAPAHISRESGGWGGALPFFGEQLPPPGERPRFVYSHVITPHPPYDRDDECNTRLSGSVAWEDIDSYREQALCANQMALTLVDQIVRMDPTAIILVQSDHGAVVRGQLSRSAAEWNDEDSFERHDAFLAARLPEACRNDLPDQITTVNILRGVLACLQDKPPEFIKERFFDHGVGPWIERTAAPVTSSATLPLAR